MSSAAKAEVDVICINAHKAFQHGRHWTKWAICNRPPLAVAPWQLKDMDMRFWWLHDREIQEQFLFFSRPCSFNLGDYFTKHHPGVHHTNIRKDLVTPQCHPSSASLRHHPPQATTPPPALSPMKAPPISRILSALPLPPRYLTAAL